MDTIVYSLVGRTLWGIDDHRSGRIDAIYVNSGTGEPEWVAVRTGGAFGTKVVFAPVTKVARQGQHAVVAFEKTYVKNAPRAHIRGALSPAEKDELCRYYGIDRGQTEVSGSVDADRWVGR
jgi:hypothetical protein